jgi:hypothetical protein
MNTMNTIFSQIMDFVPKYEFNELVKKYNGNYKVRKFSCWDQFLSMSFAQLTYRESLRDIEACLNAQPKKLYHMGIKGHVTRTNLANANQNRDWRIYAEFAQIMISCARKLYRDDSEFSTELDNTIYALDSSTIDLCLSLFPWAKFRRNKGAIKLHTLLDLRGSIPTFVEITPGAVHDINILDKLMTEPNSFYIMDRGYLDYKKLFQMNRNHSFFIIRAKNNLRFRRIFSNKVDKMSGFICDQIIKFTGQLSQKKYPDKLRRIKYKDTEKGVIYVFLTNNSEISSQTVAELYKNRWKIELFFKWIKQHLKIKAFYGNSLNAVKTQIWMAITSYVTIAIIRKTLKIEPNLYTILQILSVSLFEKVPIYQLFADSERTVSKNPVCNQLKLFNL